MQLLGLGMCHTLGEHVGGASKLGPNTQTYVECNAHTLNYEGHRVLKKARARNSLNHRPGKSIEQGPLLNRRSHTH